MIKFKINVFWDESGVKDIEHQVFLYCLKYDSKYNEFVDYANNLVEPSQQHSNFKTKCLGFKTKDLFRTMVEQNFEFESNGDYYMFFLGLENNASKTKISFLDLVFLKLQINEGFKDIVEYTKSLKDIQDGNFFHIGNLYEEGFKGFFNYLKTPSAVEKKMKCKFLWKIN